jgi:hypothetical protein
MDSEVLQVESERAEVLPERVTPMFVDGHTEGHTSLFPSGETEELRNRWRDVQGTFVDEPREAVQKANDLVERVTTRLTEVFAQERANLEKEWGAGKDVSTEDLRQALRRYRSFFDRLLSV